MVVTIDVVLVVVTGDSVEVGEGAGDVVVGPCCTAIPEQAVMTESAASRPGSRFIGAQLWHGLRANRHNLRGVFGPLNGVRTALVIAAVLAAIVSFFAGYSGAALVLLLGVGLHGLGWLYLYSTRERAHPD